MAKKKKQPSAVVALLEAVYTNACTATPHSWGRINTAMSQALALAIGAGFEFTATEFEDIVAANPGCDHWWGESERWYSQAVATGNLSAAKAYEVWKQREPFIADDVAPAPNYDRFAHSAGAREKERLHVGCTFPWKGERVSVTSFADDGASLTACTYHPTRDGEEYQRKIAKRIKITRQDIIDDRAERKERKELMKSLTQVSENGGPSAKTILEMLGVETRAEYDRLPVKKIRAVLAKLAAGRLLS